MHGQLNIDTMYAFIVRDTEGTEGIPALDTPAGPMPMVGADLERVESLRPHAEIIADEMGVNVTLAHFSNRTNVETITPRRG